jgi:4-amino-4-deoxy-L-arabinose transferase-like glycosyltransferase
METLEKTEVKKSAAAVWFPAAAMGLAIRLAVIPFLYHDWMDPFVAEHWAFGRVARSLITGHGFGNVFSDSGPTAVLPPVYAYLLAGIFRVFGDHTATSVITALAINSLFSAATCIPVFLLARQAFGDRVAKGACWGWALYPYGIYYGADWAWSTCLVTLELAWLFLWAWRLENSTRTRHWLFFGLFGGLAALTEPIVLAVVPLLALWTLYLRARKGRPWKAPLVAGALGALVIISPWITRNYDVFHEFIPIRGGFGLELYIGNNGYSARWVNSALHPNHNDEELAEYERVGEAAYMHHKSEQAKTFIRSHPRWFAWMTLRRIVYMWTGYWSFDRAYLKDEPLDPPNIFVDTTMSILALLGLRRVFQRNSSLAMRFAIVLFFFPVAYYFSHPETYYFRPVDPLVVVLAAVTVAAGKREPVAA